MNRPRCALSVLLAGTLVAATAHADGIRPRGAAAPEPLTEEEKAAQLEEKAENMDVWLPRLVGRFKYEGVVKLSGSEPVSANGLGDCIAIGDGAGVQCVIHVTWSEVWGPMGQPITGGVPFLGPAATLYGLDSDALMIRYMQLDTDGLVTDGPARLNGNTLHVRYEGFCPSEPQEVCLQETRIYAPPHRRYMHTTIEIGPLDRTSEGDSATLDLEMTPVTQDEVDALKVPARSPS